MDEWARSMIGFQRQPLLFHEEVWPLVVRGSASLYKLWLRPTRLDQGELLPRVRVVPEDVTVVLRADSTKEAFRARPCIFASIERRRRDSLWASLTAKHRSHDYPGDPPHRPIGTQDIDKNDKHASKACAEPHGALLVLFKPMPRPTWRFTQYISSLMAPWLTWLSLHRLCFHSSLLFWAEAPSQPRCYLKDVGRSYTQ